MSSGFGHYSWKGEEHEKANMAESSSADRLRCDDHNNT